MPRNLSAWVDICINMAITGGLLLVILYYNKYVASIGLVLWLCLFFYSRERCRDRQRSLDYYCKNVIKNVNDIANYAIEKLPGAILVIDADARLQWHNAELSKWLGFKPELGTSAKDFWPRLIVAPIWGTEGDYVFFNNERYYRVKHRPVATTDDLHGLMVFYIIDVTEFEQFKQQNAMSKTVLSYIQIDNYDEALQGLTEAQRTTLIFAVNQLLDEWIRSIGGFMRRVSDDLYIAVMERKALDRALADKFDILDKVRAMHGVNKFPVTLSFGVAVACDNMTLDQLGDQAQAGLDLALGRGGDQVAVQIDGKMQFYGGKAKAVEKHTRVKARVVAHAFNEILETSDAVYVMGHHNEDFDSLGAAMGIAKMARHKGKEVHIILSDMNEGIDKFTELLKGNEAYEDLFVAAKDVTTITALRPLLVVVDTHIPHMVAAQGLLDRIDQVVVIDHHRRSEHFVENPLLVYIEPASSSTSELVTELLMYFSEDLALTRLDATALYAGIVVDTKNFAVQTGVRTFDAVAYLRRCGADPVVVRHLFRTDYATTLAQAQALAASEVFPGGLIVAVCPDNIPNIQAVAAQVADGLLRIENARMSLVLFHLSPDLVGISARSTGEINVQVIMEEFGGGGHQNVAGAQVEGEPLSKIRARAIELSQQYIKENDKNESDIATGR